jgi:predicted extracellular nuclease
MSRFHALAIASLFFILCFSQGTTHASPFPDNNNCGGKLCIQIGTFNIEFLGDTKRKHYWKGTEYEVNPRTSAQMDRIAKLISKDLDLEVVVLEEIDTQSQRYQWLKTALAKEGYRFLEGTTSERNQFVVVAYDGDEVELANNWWAELNVPTDFDIPVNFQPEHCKVSGQRRPLAVTFKAKNSLFDFMLVGVHFKSKSGGSRCNHVVRDQQVRNLLWALDNLPQSKNEKDIIIAGDFNAALEAYPPLTTPDPDEIISLKRFKDAGYVDLSGAAYRAANSSGFSYLPRSFRQTIDHLMIRLAPTAEFVSKSTIIYSVPDEVTNPTGFKMYYDEVSDHAPVYSSFRIDMTDNDN